MTDTSLHLFILCGGNGNRMNEYSFPKPLNMINGKPLIYYTLQGLPEEIKELNFIVAPHLVKYNFSEIIINIFPKKKCNFHYLPYFTRGPIESAYLGIKDLNLKGSIVFLDNDNIYSFPSNFYNKYETAFIGYNINNSNSEAFSFIKINNDNNYIWNIKEKIRISSFVCCGIYGFKDLNQFKEKAYEVLNDDNNFKEYYMSIIYENLLKEDKLIEAIKFPNTTHAGSYDELKEIKEIFKNEKMRICFDLDNTIVTYPTIAGDYLTVKPIIPMIELMRKLKTEGNTIIIYTARRMKTHNNNSGAALADIGEITFKTLREFNVPYDEIIFGKPIADIYIDDKSINPYKNEMNLLGIFNDEEKKIPLNKLENNKYNTIELDNDIVKKTGLSKYLSGEIYYYKILKILFEDNNYNFNNIFPYYYKSSIDKTISSLFIENIIGIPFYSLYKNEMISEKHLNKLFKILKKLHNYKYENNNQFKITSIDIINNYSTKLIERFKIKEDYPFEDAEEIQTIILNRLENYYKSQNNIFEISDFIHGDLWFSNILIDYSNNIKFIDMKGKLYNNYNTGGHIYYDYGKLYQSFLGFDEILNNDNINKTYKNKLLDYYKNYLNSININIEHLNIITFSLVIGTFHSISNEETKIKLWNWIKKTFI
jgi:capsule biosynthesis phosphatase